MLPSGRQTVINNRIGWARTYLNKAGLLSIPSKGLVQITERGREALQTGPQRITIGWLKRYPEFSAFHGARPDNDASSVQAEPVGDITPDEQLAQAHQFSAGAREAALGLDIKVVLIDGVELARLMVENNLGCSVKLVYEIKHIDSDYFTED